MATIPIWNKAAKDYDTYVTHSKKRLLLCYIEKEREFISKMIQKVKDVSSRNVTIFEVGCGTGRIAFDIINNQNLAKSIDYIIGIDNAEEMVRAANDILFERLRMPNNSDYKKILFSLMDALEMNNYFYDGKIDLSKVKRNGLLKLCHQIDPDKYNQSIKLAVLALNTLGSFRPQTRGEVIKSMKNLVGQDGFVIVSVFSAKDFKYVAKQIYTSMLPLVGATNESDLEFDIDKKKKKYVFLTNSGYFSEWFTRKALLRFLKIVGKEESFQTVVDEKSGKEIALMFSASPAKEVKADFVR